MKKKDKHRTERSEMLRYFNGEMTSREKNAFERKLQKDLFSSEAEEGLSGLSGDQVTADLSHLENRLKSRVSGKRTYVFYRIAASVAVLLVLSSVFIILNRKNQPEKQSEITSQPVTIDIMKSKPIEETPAADEEKDKITLADNVISETVVPGKEAEDVLHEDVADVIKVEETDIKGKNDIAREEQRPAELLAARQKIGGIPVSAAGAPAGASLAKTLDVSEQKKEINTGDSMISAMDELVVISYGGEKKADNLFEGYSGPFPAGGKPAFENYIGENIRRPASMAEGQKEVVVVNLIVKSTGAIDSVKVIRSPGKEFSDEAIRLIKEGPAWNPAENNGIKIDDEVRVRIIFR